MAEYIVAKGVCKDFGIFFLDSSWVTIGVFHFNNFDLLVMLEGPSFKVLDGGPFFLEEVQLFAIFLQSICSLLLFLKSLFVCLFIVQKFFSVHSFVQVAWVFFRCFW